MMGSKTEGAACHCASLTDSAVIRMTGDGLHERVFATLDQVRKHGGCQWWLYASICNVCGQGWMIAQDERIHDNFYLKRLSADALKRILEYDSWPNDFLTFEQVLRIGVESGNICRLLDPHSPDLVHTVEDLRRERPDISEDQIAALLGISIGAASELLNDP